MITQQECELIAAAVVKALQEAQNQDSDVLPDGTQMRAALKDATTFADANRRLERGGIANAGRRRALIARHSPNLFNAIMSEPYTG